MSSGGGATSGGDGDAMVREFADGALRLRCFFHADSNTCQYVVWCTLSKQCAVVDACWDYDAASATVTSTSADELVAFVREQQLRCVLVCETHPHADHLSAAQYVKRVAGDAELGCQYVIGEHVCQVQANFKPVYNFEWLATDGSQFDRLVAHGARVPLGPHAHLLVWHTPGHTPACVSYVLCARAAPSDDGADADDAGGAVAAFVGDTLFAPDAGTARADFIGGSAGALYDSVRRLLTRLEPPTTLLLCHDYQPGGRELVYATTVAEHRASNKHVKDGVERDQYVHVRTTRDATLKYPRLLLPSIQVNVNGGVLPPADADGKHFLKIPITNKSS